MTKRVPFDKKGAAVSNPDYTRDHDTIGGGKPDCPYCGGRGVVLLPTEERKPPSFKSCKCVKAKNIAYNVEQGWKGLMKAPGIKGSPLGRYVEQNLWVRASQPFFQRHLRHVAIRHIAKRGPWFFKVVTDADLITAWLATTVLQGGELLDPDLRNPSLEHLTLVDLILPPDLLIVHLGVKRAANKEMAGVLYEALSTRYHEDKPTWLFDQPYNPLQNGHLCFDFHLMDSLEVWGYTGPIALGRGGQNLPEYGVHEIIGDEGDDDGGGDDGNDSADDNRDDSAGEEGEGQDAERDEFGASRDHRGSDVAMGLFGGGGPRREIKHNSEKRPYNSRKRSPSKKKK